MDCSIARGTGAAIVLSAGLAIAAAARGQSPLEEPFPAVFELRSLVPVRGGDGSLGSVFEENQIRAWFGWSAAGAGDVNGDGLADIVIGSPLADAATGDGAGLGYVFFGTTSGFPAATSPAILTGDNGFRLAGVAGDQLGIAVAPAGDVNGDGVGDVIFGANLFDADAPFRAGAAFVIYGRDGGGFPADLAVTDIDGTNGFAFLGVDEEGECGYAVAGIGDINGDGVDDIAIGATDVGRVLRRPRGEAYIVFGRTDGFPPALRPNDLDGRNGFVIEAVLGGNLGQAIARLGDVNGDGIDDVAVGAPSGMVPGGENEQGIVHVLYGRPSSTPFPASLTDDLIVPPVGFKLVGTRPGDVAGWALGDAGDVNHDGLNDIVVASHRADPGERSEAGVTYVVYGRDIAGSGAAPFPAVLTLGDMDGMDGFRIEGVNMDDLTGLSASAGGDVNGDGIDDILIGAWGLDPDGRANAGGAYLVYGRDERFPAILPLAALTEDQGVRFHGIYAGDVTGRATNVVGDVNGDGVADLLLGAERAWPGGRREAGEAYLVYGRGGSDPCPVDLDGDGALTIFDYLVFQGYFALGDPKADFDGDGSLTIFDFLAYQNAFDLGCP